MPFLDFGTCRRPSVFDCPGQCHVIGSLLGWVPINPINQLVGWCRHGSSEFYGFDADRDFSAALNILHRGLGMSLKPGGNAPARRENENDGVALTLPTA